MWLLSPDAALKDSHIKSPLYHLFQGGLEDNDGKIDFLKRLDAWGEKIDRTTVDMMKGILGNVLRDISWEDRSVLNKVSPVIISLFKHNNFNDVISKNVTDIAVRDKEDFEVIGSHHRGLEHLYVGSSIKMSNLSQTLP